MSNDDIEVRNNQEADRYEIELDGEVAVLTYAQKGDHIVFLHTEVPSALEGHGIASKLAHTALEEAREHHLMVVPACSFVAAYIRRHPEYLPLLSEAQQLRLQQRS